MLVDRSAADAWISAHVAPAGPIELTHERPWSTVLRVPLADGAAWFKACSSVQAFEPRLTAALHGRWPGLMPEVLGFDAQRGWLLLADAGTRIGDLGNLPEFWIELLPRYAELQRGEVAYVDDHLAHGVPDLRVATLAERYDELLAEDLPVSSAERRALTDFAPAFARLSGELSSEGPADSIQHDDLHMHNVYRQGDRLRVLDWGDSSISHPFASLVTTASWRNATAWPRTTRRWSGCAMRISKGGGPGSPGSSTWRCGSAASPTPSPSCGSGGRCRDRRERYSTTTFRFGSGGRCGAWMADVRHRSHRGPATVHDRDASSWSTRIALTQSS